MYAVLSFFLSLYSACFCWPIVCDGFCLGYFALQYVWKLINDSTMSYAMMAFRRRMAWQALLSILFWNMFTAEIFIQFYLTLKCFLFYFYIYSNRKGFRSFSTHWLLLLLLLFIAKSLVMCSAFFRCCFLPLFTFHSFQSLLSLERFFFNALLFYVSSMF